MTSAYRTTLRMHPVFKDYLDELFHCTYLDRTQLIRLALATAPSNPEFIKLLRQYQKSKTSLPSIPWDVSDNTIFLEQCPDISRGGEGYHNDVTTGRAEIKTAPDPGDIKRPVTEPENIQNRCIQQTERRTGEVLERKFFKESGGIKITIN
ncbi:hypothetical protein E2K98_24815 [Bacillus salipaludis]|uniref:Uncharacterized protein n=1 Tax=Bacillus salipaludis TaxID=2547811 RepID=A0A4R5VKB7_9BACI|nr:hypothetical protein [Bacillus salipaludis]TDK58142.1 hypothetical protein E2K98_24815 [Bacillus salipaludis]